MQRKSLLGKNKSKMLYAVTNYIVRILQRKNIIRNKSGCVIDIRKEERSI